MAHRPAALPGPVLDAQGPEEDAELVGGAVGDEHLDVFRKQLHGALALSGELCEQFEVFQNVALRDFAVVQPQDDLLEFVASQDDGGFADELTPSGLS